MLPATIKQLVITSWRKIKVRIIATVSASFFAIRLTRLVSECFCPYSPYLPYHSIKFLCCQVIPLVDPLHGFIQSMGFFNITIVFYHQYYKLAILQDRAGIKHTFPSLPSAHLVYIDHLSNEHHILNILYHHIFSIPFLISSCNLS